MPRHHKYDSVLRLTVDAFCEVVERDVARLNGEIGRVLALRKMGIKRSEIAKLEGLSMRRVKHILDKYKQDRN